MENSLVENQYNCVAKYVIRMHRDICNKSANMPLDMKDKYFKIP